ncbi:MAG TPA: RNA 2',3'-cyclic phosphodiesterase [Alphaproteobacteria bacterium]|nr:RNA 2',3'-cyclic phosphodiesterase [Alphaproteobacteria bacterium]
MIRLFTALDLPEAVRDRLAMLQSGVPGARWIRPENLHVTLRFIGEVDEHVAEDLDASLARAAAPGFDLRLSGVGHFGTERKPTTLWVGVERSDALQFLHDKVDRALVAAGLTPDDRKFKPHVTLARLRSHARVERVGRWLEANALFQAGPIRIDGFVLYRSHLGSEGSVYEPLVEYPLKEAA